MNRLLSVREVASVLGVSVHTVHAWVGSGRIPFVKLGRRTLFEQDQVHRWVEGSSYSPGAVRGDEGADTRTPEPGLTPGAVRSAAPRLKRSSDGHE